MKVTVTMDHAEWLQEKQRIAIEARTEGSVQGYWTAVADLDSAANNSADLGFGPGVTDSQKSMFLRVLDKLQRTPQ